MLKKRTAIELIVLFVLSLLPLWWFQGDQILLGHDSGFRIVPWDHLRNLFYSWNPFLNFGRDWSLYKAFLVIQFPETLFTFITSSAIWGQRLTLILWFFLMGFGTWLGVYLVFPESSYRFFRLWASVFAMYNFFILQAWFIAERAKFSLFAALPIAIGLLYRAMLLDRSITLHVLALGLLYFLLNGGGSPPLYGATAVSLVGAYMWFGVLGIRKSGWRSLRRTMLVGVGFAGIFALLNAYWIIPQIGLYVGTYAQAFSDNGGMEGLIAWERVISKNASIVNLLRLQGIPDWYDTTQHSFSRAFLTHPFLIAASFIPALLAGTVGLLLWLGKKKEKQHVGYLLFLFVLLGAGLILAAGSHPPFGSAFVWAMRHVPGFAIFRSSFYKFGPLVWFPIIILSGYAIQMWLLRINNISLRRLLAVGSIMGLLLYHYPFFYSDIFRFYDRFTTRVSVPKYVGEIGSYVNTNIHKENRILVLPALDSGYYNLVLDTTTWGYFSLDLLPRTIFAPSVVANDNGSNSVIGSLYKALHQNDKKRFDRLTSLMGITHIIWRGDAIYKTPYADARGIEAQKKQLASWSYPLVIKKGEWELYNISNSPSPRVFRSGDIVSVDGENADHATILTTFLSDPKTITADELLSDIADNPQRHIYQARCIHCDGEERARVLGGITIADLRFAPGSFFYSRIVNGQVKALQKSTTPAARIDVQIIRANNSLALLKWKFSENEKGSLEKIILEYEEYMDDVLHSYGKLAGKEKNEYAIRLISFIDAQDRYVQGVGLDTELFHAVHTRIGEYKKEVSEDVWITDNAIDLKYDVQIASNGEYELVSLPKAGRVVIDGRVVNNDAVSLQAGYHKILVGMNGNQEEIPQLFLAQISKPSQPHAGDVLSFNHVNPARYDIQLQQNLPGYLFVNEEFDRRWKLKVNGKKVSETVHFRANGYANGWYIDESGLISVTVYYEPYDQFQIGIIVSLVGFIGVGVIMIWWRKRRLDLYGT